MWIHYCHKCAKPHVPREIKSGKVCKKCGEHEAPPGVMQGPRRQITELVEGDEYVDEPIYRKAVVLCAKKPILGKELIALSRVRLRWMKPDGRGGLVPKAKRKN